LMVTLLDAHPDIAMSYELYPTLLKLEDGQPDTLMQIAESIAKARNIKQAAKRVDHDGLRVFLLRCPRGGLDHRDFATILMEHAGENSTLTTVPDRLKLIEKCCKAKMNAVGKTRWGLKCNNRYRDYLARWPDAYFVNVLRDGRDVLASQLRIGTFKNTTAQVAQSWATTNRRFRDLLADSAVKAYQVRYEDLVTNPADELRKITDFLRLRFDDSMLNYHRQELTIYSTSHLSMDRIAVAVDGSRVGRWKRELTSAQVLEFLESAGDALREFGYDD
ncbi:MAG: sulfotransferase, partial [Gammaproteobacteria bacterium]